MMKLEEKNTKIKRKKLPLIINVLKKISKKNDSIVISALCITKIIGKKEQDLSKFKIIINDKEYNIKFKLKKGIPLIKNFKIDFYEFEIPIDEAAVMDIQNKIQVKYENLDLGRIIYSCWDLTKGKNHHSKIIVHNNKSFFLRQTIKNTMYLTVRDTNEYDFKKSRVKLTLGWLLSKIMLKNDFILLFEKESSRYEESASVLYEKLIDMGYKNVYYIINSDNVKLNEINEKYKKNIIYKDSLKHITYFFKCKKFVGTESLGHAMQLRIASKLVVDKLNKRDLMYVFLQHGVMYMVSLSSDLRTGFKKMPIKLHKIVTSSEEEAKHFIDLGGFEREDLYVCGLPKFDKAIRNKNADKIVIMPTWRRWEANQASIDYENTKYYKMIQRIVKAIPEKLQEKIVILPHPLMLKEIKNNKEYSKYIPEENFVYDEILKECKLLITDYSSIAYDAYYRGSNVIFYWEEKEECMKEYGENTILMLNEKNVFADVCYNEQELSKVVEKNYNGKHSKENEKKYKKIVEFDDNKNTERLIQMLINDKIIKQK